MAAKKSSGATKSKSETKSEQPPPTRSLPIAENGIKTGPQFSALMSALMTDLLSGSVTPGIANATCNAGGKLLKMVELNLKYGQQQIDGGMKTLQLVGTDKKEQ
jgi:hypothetical protein